MTVIYDLTSRRKPREKKVTEEPVKDETIGPGVSKRTAGGANVTPTA